MRDLFEPDEGSKPADPTRAARQAARPVLRKRFYAAAAIAERADGFSVTLDGKPVRTPAGEALRAPRRALAEALRAEWEQQDQVIDPARMPLTRLANAIIDGVTVRAAEAIDDIVNYLGSDLLFYRADGPKGLVARQAEFWDPVLRWAADEFDARFILVEGIVHARQPDPAIAALRAAIPQDPWTVGGLHAVTTLTGSALLALALARGFLDAAATWRAAHVDEDWNLDKWGTDDLALARRAAREAEFKAAALVLTPPT